MPAPNKLTIRIATEGTAPDEQTVSHFVVAPKDHVSFTNSAKADATVDFGSATPICKPNQTEVFIVELGPGDTEPYRVCDDAEGKFKYTATVVDADPEDPIVVVDRALIVQDPPGINPIVVVDKRTPGEDAMSAAAGFLFGVAVAWLVFSRFRREGPPTRP
jgi:hypothetical protein